MEFRVSIGLALVLRWRAVSRGGAYVRRLSGALKRNERVLGEGRISRLTNGETEPKFFDQDQST